jgi:hypothetical protein
MSNTRELHRQIENLQEENRILSRHGMLVYLLLQKEWSEKTFGTGRRTEGICKHIEKELQEIRKNPADVYEWVDVVILALDGAWRAGHTPLSIIAAMHTKAAVNRAREWPAPVSEDEPVEHVKAK